MAVKSFETLKKLSLFFLKKKGFSLIELLTSVGIIGTLSVIGIKSYQGQINKARTAEAKYSLSAVYAAEKNFKEVWGTYHENLIVIGIIPDGPYHYDVGFKSTATLSQTDGNLETYPVKTDLVVKECTNFYQICSNDCRNKAAKPLGKTSTYLFYNDPNAGSKTALQFNCNVNSSLYMSGYTARGDADENTFTAIARSKLKNEDVWSVNQEKTFEHVTDGTH